MSSVSDHRTYGNFQKEVTISKSYHFAHSLSISECHGQNANVCDATDFCFWELGFWSRGDRFLYWGFGWWLFVVGVLSRDHYVLMCKTLSQTKVTISRRGALFLWTTDIIQLWARAVIETEAIEHSMALVHTTQLPCSYIVMVCTTSVLYCLHQTCLWLECIQYSACVCMCLNALCRVIKIIS